MAAGAAVGASDPSPPKFLCRRGALLELADGMLQQLHSPLIAEGAAAQALKNLLWVSTAVVQCPGLAPISCKASLPGRATRVHGAAGANNGGRGRGGGDDDANDDDDNSDEEHQQQQLRTRMARMASMAAVDGAAGRSNRLPPVWCRS